MKKFLRRCAALLMAGAMLITALPTGALAQEGVSPSFSVDKVVRGGDGETGYCLLTTKDGLGEKSVGNAPDWSFASPAGVNLDGSLYSQLNKRQKACYDALEAISIDKILSIKPGQDGYRVVKARIDEIYGTLLSGTIQGTAFTVGTTSASLQAGIYTDLYAAITALRYDRADLLWMQDLNYGYAWSKSKDNVVKITDVIFAFNLKCGGQEKKLWEAMLAQAESIADEVNTEADTYSKVKKLHDLLAQNNTYNDEPAGELDETISHLAYSALIGGDAYEPVCDGYAKAFQVVCGYLDIPCVLASSNDHMWNNVRMDDGEWYNLDLTWDDTNDDEISYDYFLIGSQTEIDGTPFNKQPYHVEENPYKKTASTNALTLRFPGKSTKKYEYKGEDYPPLRFSDVRRSSWYYEYVETAAENGLFQGDKDGLFNPDKKITRAEFVQVMANSMNVDLSAYKGSPFSDVKEDAWYAPAIAWAKETGLMKGYENNRFRPGMPISREEMCVVFFNSIGKTGETGNHVFPDDKRISSWAKEAVYACFALGLIKGNSDGSFAPKANTLRSEAATVFTRFIALSPEPNPAPEEGGAPAQGDIPAEGDPTVEGESPAGENLQ